MGWDKSNQEVSIVEIATRWGWILSLLRVIMRLDSWSWD